MIKIIVKSSDLIIDQSHYEESKEQLSWWLDGNKSSYPQDAIVEYHAISYEDELKECFDKRKNEYPSPEEFMNAWFDGGTQSIHDLELKRLSVKAKYPKPQPKENTLIESVVLFPVAEEPTESVE